jgi:hypothetical protein
MNGIPLSPAATPIINVNHSERQNARFGGQTLHEVKIIGVDRKHLHIEIEVFFSETIFRKYSAMAGSRCGT